MKRGFTFTDERGDGGIAEAARFIGAYAGCVPRSREWKALAPTIKGFEDMEDEDLSDALKDALDLLRKGVE